MAEDEQSMEARHLHSHINFIIMFMMREMKELKIVKSLSKIKRDTYYSIIMAAAAAIAACIQIDVRCCIIAIAVHLIVGSC